MIIFVTKSNNMEDTSKSPEQLIEVIKPEAIVNIKMSTGYYRRVQEATLHIVEGKTKEELEASLEEIKSNKVTSEWVKHYQTLLILCKEFETQAKADNLTEMISTTEFQERLAKYESSPSDSQSDD